MPKVCRSTLEFSTRLLKWGCGRSARSALPSIRRKRGITIPTWLRPRPCFLRANIFRSRALRGSRKFLPFRAAAVLISAAPATESGGKPSRAQRRGGASGGKSPKKKRGGGATGRRDEKKQSTF